MIKFIIHLYKKYKLLWNITKNILNYNNFEKTFLQSFFPVHSNHCFYIFFYSWNWRSKLTVIASDKKYSRQVGKKLLVCHISRNTIVFVQQWLTLLSSFTKNINYFKIWQWAWKLHTRGHKDTQWVVVACPAQTSQRRVATQK